MNTPIVDFTKKYADKNGVRAHMPGHKGKSFTGAEKYDITEISGADVLYSASGIIQQSQDNARDLFNTYATFYSTEGSSLCIKAMLSLVSKGKQNPTIVATRNAHKTFIYGCALLGIEPVWVYPDDFTHLCSCIVSPQKIEEEIKAQKDKPCAVYITSPDYLGSVLDVEGIAKVCDKYGIPLLVDNAHGAYLAFTKEKNHPILLGATMCCDSAHKTLPSLTGGAYLHLSQKAKEYESATKSAMSLFASTSPSYLILQSLDLVNAYIAEHKAEFIKTQESVEKLKRDLISDGFVLVGSEPFKLTLDIKKSGINTENLIYVLRKSNVECEFLDNEYAVFMFSTCSQENDFLTVKTVFSALEKGEVEQDSPTRYAQGEKVLSVRDAIMSNSETISVANSLNRVCASPLVSCPPAIPVVVSGEKITPQSLTLLQKYGITEIEVTK